ncbi:MAG: DUF3251 domain-containing protein [Limisphaera sp.]|nr:DUF3251 domain-containing protein [Limisphaera sp.]
MNASLPRTTSAQRRLPARGVLPRRRGLGSRGSSRRHPSGERQIPARVSSKFYAAPGTEYVSPKQLALPPEQDPAISTLAAMVTSATARSSPRPIPLGKRQILEDPVDGAASDRQTFVMELAGKTFVFSLTTLSQYLLLDRRRSHLSTPMNIHYPMLAILVIATMTSCSPDATTTARIDQLEKRIEAQNTAIAQLEKTIEAQNTAIAQFEKKIETQNTAIAQFGRSTSDALDKKVNTMAQSLVAYVTKLESDVRVELFSLRQSFKKVATLDPASKGYSPVSTDKGVLLFAVDGAEPFLDGHKFILRIGNPMNMTFSGFKLKVRYGKRPPAFPSFEVGDTNAVAVLQKWARDMQGWEKTVRETEFSFTDSLEPGAWNKIDFILKETKPEDVAHLEVSIETDRISLRRPLSDLK